MTAQSHPPAVGWHVWLPVTGMKLPTAQMTPGRQGQLWRLINSSNCVKCKMLGKKLISAPLHYSPIAPQHHCTTASRKCRDTTTPGAHASLVHIMWVLFWCTCERPWCSIFGYLSAYRAHTVAHSFMCPVQTPCESERLLPNRQSLADVCLPGMPTCSHRLHLIQGSAAVEQVKLCLLQMSYCNSCMPFVHSVLHPIV